MVSGVARSERLVLVVQLVSVGVLRVVGALLLSRAGEVGCEGRRASAARSAPSAPKARLSQ